MSLYSLFKNSLFFDVAGRYQVSIKRVVVVCMDFREQRYATLDASIGSFSIHRVPTDIHTLFLETFSGKTPEGFYCWTIQSPNPDFSKGAALRYQVVQAGGKSVKNASRIQYTP